ncbi:lytic transglycosylase domain-containing protein [Marinobacter adhaerens]|uniref:Lytic transglycosylase domain-containing protein n=1 Tax=Marinobacter adhaerens TaxID=1033846 RepID=A0A851HMY4_9GAMM|nr:lytic transglycosylase domain-containing protein [Marinobacter adhaerens]NWN91179.1 lytic transglycosylase domain-containing protein [Marinobacter adhaerens]
MVHLRHIAFPILTALIWHCTPVSADSIKRIEHPDGRVEFTNISSNNPGRASTKNETVFRYKDDKGIVAYSETRPSVTDFDVISFHCYACDPDSTVNWRTTPLFSGRYEREIKTAAREHDVDPALVRAVIHAESAYNEKALSPVGAQGLMQLMPETALEVGVQNAMVAADNIRGGVTYLARMLERFEGDTRLATAAYNAGPGTVSRYKGVPPYAETRAYVERVNILRERYASN